MAYSVRGCGHNATSSLTRTFTTPTGEEVTEEMDLITIKPQFNLYNRRWPIRTGISHDPPAKFVFRAEASERIGALERDASVVFCGRSLGDAAEEVLAAAEAIGARDRRIRALLHDPYASGQVRGDAPILVPQLGEDRPYHLARRR